MLTLDESVSLQTKQRSSVIEVVCMLGISETIIENKM